MRNDSEIEIKAREQLQLCEASENSYGETDFPYRKETAEIVLATYLLRARKLKARELRAA